MKNSLPSKQFARNRTQFGAPFGHGYWKNMNQSKTRFSFSVIWLSKSSRLNSSSSRFMQSRPKRSPSSHASSCTRSTKSPVTANRSGSPRFLTSSRKRITVVPSFDCGTFSTFSNRDCTVSIAKLFIIVTSKTVKTVFRQRKSSSVYGAI